MIVVCAYAPKNNPEYFAFWERVDGVLKNVPSTDSIVVRVTSMIMMAMTGKPGRNTLPDLNQSDGLLLDLCPSPD